MGLNDQEMLLLSLFALMREEADQTSMNRYTRRNSCTSKGCSSKQAGSSQGQCYHSIMTHVEATLAATVEGVEQKLG